MTWGDKLRAMTDEELAEVFCLIECGLGPIGEYSSADDWRDWLQREVEDGN